jgi:Ca2+-binding EF-hand superfamily protein
MFAKYDKDGDGPIDFAEFENMLVQLGLAPKKKRAEMNPDVYA